MSSSREQELRRLFRGFQSLFQPAGKAQQRAFPPEWHVGRFIMAMVTPLTVWAALTYLEHTMEKSPRPFSRALEEAANRRDETQEQEQQQIESGSVCEPQQQQQQQQRRLQASLEQEHQLNKQQHSQYDARLRAVEGKLEQLLASLQPPGVLTAQRERQQRQQQQQQQHQQQERQKTKEQEQQESSRQGQQQQQQEKPGQKHRQQQGSNRGLREVSESSQETKPGTDSSSSDSATAAA